MNRVFLLLACAGLLTGCESEPVKPSKRTERFEAVPAAAVKDDAVDAFCDTHDESDMAPTFTWPALDGAVPTMNGWTWVNTWATWCAPCVAEMPMLERWKETLAKQGVEFNLAFFSVDAKAADVQRWATSHPTITLGPRIADFGLLAAWLPTVGLNANASIPIHFFVDDHSKIRCTRMGAISEPDLAVVKQILSK